MTSFELDKNNNLVVEGYIGIVDNNEALEQDIKNIIMLQKKEYIYDINKGVDWIQFIQTKDAALLLNNIETQIYKDKRVKSVIIEASKSDNNFILIIKTTANDEVIINV